MKNIIVPIILIFTIYFYAVSYSQEYTEELLLDGLDSLVSFGIDTTGHWWAATMPFKDRYRVYIDTFQSELYDDVLELNISSDGEQWAFWGIQAGTINLINRDEFGVINTLPLNATDVGDIVYSPDGTQFAYTFFQGDNEIINLPTRQITVVNRNNNKLFIDNSGKQYAFVGQRGNKFIININGKESTIYDEIKPIGFWHKGTFMYAGFNGNTWEIINGTKTIGTSYWRVLDHKINNFGTVMAVLVQLSTGRCMSITFSDEYYEPIYGRSYDDTWGLALHPKDVLIGHGAKEHHKYYILQNRTEYYATEEISAPFFSHNGDELIFIGMGEYGPYISVNGNRTDIRVGLYPEDMIAKKPNTETLAFTNNISLYLYDYKRNTLKSGNMYDYLSNPIYNRRTNSYEALAIIYNRLYLCKWRM
ncbi:MAG: hypothetical protein FWG85_02370 [Bacteroidetes bacterium]|nr:hypothetical protein [Bacteroidota bacterium]